MAGKNEKQTKDVATVDAAALVKNTTKALALDDDDMVAVGKGVAPGYEHQTAEDASIPWIVLLQAGSPQVAEGKVPGAQAGMFMNTVTGKLWDARHDPGKSEAAKQPVVFIPATTRHEFVEWKPDRGGLVGRHEIDSPVVAKAKAEYEFGEWKTPDGNDLTETFYIFGVIDDGTGQPEGMAVIALSSTKIKTYKNWIAKIRAHTVEIDGNKFQPAMYANIAKMTCWFEKFDEGSAWVTEINPLFGAVKDSLIPKTDPRFQMAKLCKQMVEQGAAKVDYAKQAAAATEGGAGAAPGGKPF